MEDGDVSLAVRRARRSGAKSLDLSHRGIRSWPEGIFALRHLEKLDVSGNELEEVDAEGLRQLELLKELNVANNRLRSLPEIDLGALKRLQSLNIEGNPVAARISPGTVRRLAQPSSAEALASLLRQAQGEMGGEAVAERTVVEEISAADCGPELLGPREASEKQASMTRELERLRARVAELEAAPPASGSNKSLPAWLQEDPKQARGGLSQTLPSRQRNLMADDEASQAKEQLQQEQRKSKRLEKELQKLSERLNERDMVRGSVGSVPHFDFADVDLGEIMAQGGFSVVHKGHWHTTKVACKKLFDPNINEELLAEFDNEVSKLEQVRHPNILMLLAVHRKPPALAMITELVEGGSFYQLLHTPSKFNITAGLALSGDAMVLVNSSKRLEITEVAGTAIAFLHARGIVHRDVKSQNVLLSPTLDVKLCDFGLARMKSELMTGAMQFAGTPNYMAPEMFRNQKYSENVDVFAFGTMLWEALVMDIPFANLDPADIREKVLVGDMPSASSLPTATQAILRFCWTPDRERRPSMSEVVRRIRSLPQPPC